MNSFATKCQIYLVKSAKLSTPFRNFLCRSSTRQNHRPLREQRITHHCPRQPGINSFPRHPYQVAFAFLKDSMFGKLLVRSPSLHFLSISFFLTLSLTSVPFSPAPEARNEATISHVEPNRRYQRREIRYSSAMNMHTFC